MRLGLLADIHEEVGYLQRAIEELRLRRIDRFVVLGDIFETGRHLEETAEVLAGLDSLGVWGNHDFGLCVDVRATVRARYPARVLHYFAGLRPALELGGCYFQHIEPYLDPGKLDDLWSYGGGAELNPAASFGSVPHRRVFMGHLHRWRLVTPQGTLGWDGSIAVRLDTSTRYLAVLHAVQQGWCALFDTEQDELTPIRVA